MGAPLEHQTSVMSIQRPRWLGEPASEASGFLRDVAPMIPAFDRFPFGANARLDMIVRRAGAAKSRSSSRSCDRTVIHTTGHSRS
jgi:hypothetical protein